MANTFSNDLKIQQLLELTKHITLLEGAIELLGWDQEVLMPKKAVASRAKQLAVLSETAHNKLIDPRNGDLIQELENAVSNSPDKYTLEDKALIREFKRKYEKETKLPVEFVKEFTEHTSNAMEVWKNAREKADFGIFANDLKKTVELCKQKAEYYGYEDSPYDALLDLYEQDLTAKRVAEIFEPLKSFTIDLLNKIQNSDIDIDNNILHRSYDIQRQWDFCLQVAEGLGYDFQAGRLDESTHPFTSELGTATDVRITTRFYDDQVQASIMSTIHEVGHALYEQGVAGDLDTTILGTGVSLGIHESQSRMWENFVGRTPEFWNYWYPRFVNSFEHVVNLNEEEYFVKALNKVEPSLIRVEADEVTYNLHIILRFEIERDLLEGKIEVKDLPEIWNSKMQTYLGVTPPNDAMGALQDIHWSMGGLGYFPTYSLGNLYAAQFWNTILQDIPDIKTQLAVGNYSVLLTWLRQNIHVYGSIYPPQQLCRKITGEDLNPEYLKNYLNEKFGKLYNLESS